MQPAMQGSGGGMGMGMGMGMNMPGNMQQGNMGMPAPRGMTTHISLEMPFSSITCFDPWVTPCSLLRFPLSLSPR